MSLPVYSARDVRVSWGGVPIEGFAPDSFVEFEFNSDLTDEEVGGDGQVSVSITPDRTATCTISLQKESPSNIALSGVLNAQIAGGRKLAREDLYIADPSGSGLARLVKAHIKTAPTISYSSVATGTTYQWTFFCESMTFQAVSELDPILAAAQPFVDTLIATAEVIG